MHTAVNGPLVADHLYRSMCRIGPNAQAAGRSVVLADSQRAVRCQPLVWWRGEAAGAARAGVFVCMHLDRVGARRGFYSRLLFLSLILNKGKGKNKNSVRPTSGPPIPSISSDADSNSLSATGLSCSHRLTWPDLRANQAPHSFRPAHEFHCFEIDGTPTSTSQFSTWN